METLFFYESLSCFSFNSDPTYEAWKPLKIDLPHLYLLNSDPTYEAWKLDRYADGFDSWAYSDPTYEAWKQIFSRK